MSRFNKLFLPTLQKLCGEIFLPFLQMTGLLGYPAVPTAKDEARALGEKRPSVVPTMLVKNVDSCCALPLHRNSQDGRHIFYDYWRCRIWAQHR